MIGSSKILIIFFVFSLVVASRAVAAQEEDLLGGATAAESNSAATELTGAISNLKEELEEEVRNRLQSLDIPGLKLDLKAFDSDENGNSYGLSYDYNLSKKNELDLLNLEANTWYRDWALDFATKGNVAFKKDLNPKDFLEASVALRGFATLSTGKHVGLTPIEETRLAADCTTESIQDRSCTSFHNVKERMEASLGLLTTLHFGLDAGYEADQQFDATQDTLGAFVAVKLFDARDGSMLSKLNIFDYPFAVLRNLTGRARCETSNICFKPTGRSFPLLLVSLDNISPDAETPRAMAGDDSDYLRVNFEAAFNTPVAYWQRVDVYFTASYRYYRELDASMVVEGAGLDSSELLTLTVGGRDGLFVSYAKGKLPFGIQRDETIEIGWKFNL